MPEFRTRKFWISALVRLKRAFQKKGKYVCYVMFQTCQVIMANKLWNWSFLEISSGVSFINNQWTRTSAGKPVSFTERMFSDVTIKYAELKFCPRYRCRFCAWSVIGHKTVTVNDLIHVNKIFENVKRKACVTTTNCGEFEWRTSWQHACDHKLCRIETDARAKNARDRNHALHVRENYIATSATRRASSCFEKSKRKQISARDNFDRYHRNGGLQLLDWSSRCFNWHDRKKQHSTRIHASPFVSLKHGEAQTSNDKLSLSIVPSGIVSNAFTLWVGQVETDMSLRNFAANLYRLVNTST